MLKKAVCSIALTGILVMTGYAISFAEKIQTRRFRYMEWGFNIELPVGWERQNHKVPDYSFYTCVSPLKENETEPEAKINILVGSKKEEHDDELFFEKTLGGVTGKEIDRGTITIDDPKSKMTGRWIHYSQQRSENEDVKVLAYTIFEKSIVYIIICYANDDVYDDYESLFKNVVKSLRSEKITISK